MTIDWTALEAKYDWVRRLSTTPQDPVHHAEGDVGIHTRMVCEALVGNPRYSAMSKEAQETLFWAALLHDVAKPDCTRVGDDGRVTSPGHSVRGAMAARVILWRLGVPFAMREEVCALVRHHQAPFWLLEREDPRRIVLGMSHALSCERLALLAESDARGRTCEGQARILDNVELFRAYCEEQNCFDRPYSFPSDHARFRYLSGHQASPDHRPHEDFRCEAVLMSGFPGAGKDTWVAANLPGWPVVSLDRLRAEMGIHPDDDQGRIISAAREEARGHLRASRSFVWNATNLSKRIRAQCTRIFTEYGARVRIVYVEVPEPLLHAQNEKRPRPVPARVYDALLEKWEVPDASEADALTFALRG